MDEENKQKYGAAGTAGGGYRKKMSKLLNIKEIKQQMQSHIKKVKTEFTKAASQTQSFMRLKGQEVSLQASFVCLLHLANE